MPETEPLRVNYLRKYVPEPKREPWECPPVDVYSPTQAMLVLCHALRSTLDTLDMVLADEEPTTMADLCGREIRDALRLMIVLEQYGAREGTPVCVCDSDAWFDWDSVPKRPSGWVEVD